MYSNNHCLVFSHDENSTQYSNCDVKGGDISDHCESVALNKGMPTAIPLYGNRFQATSVLIENKIKPQSLYMYFSYLKNVETIDVSNVITDNVTEFTSCFSNSETLSSLNISNWKFNENADVKGMFSGCFELTTINYPSYIPTNQRMFCTYQFSDNVPQSVCPANRPEGYTLDKGYFYKDTSSSVKTTPMYPTNGYNRVCFHQKNKGKSSETIKFYDANGNVIKTESYLFQGYGSGCVIPSGATHFSCNFSNLTQAVVSFITFNNW